MYKNIAEDICGEVNYASLNLFGEKLKVGVIGGGRGALIKVKSFYNKGSKIEVLSLDFLEEFNTFNKDKVNLIKGSYNKEFIKDKHLIVIAINDEDTINKIQNDCENLYKIYINCAKFKNGMGVIPVSRHSKNISIAVSTRLGNPRAAVMVADNIYNQIKKFDNYVEFTSSIRNNLNLNIDKKYELLAFINSEDCKEFYEKGKIMNILRLFFSEDIVKEIAKLRKEE